MLPAHGGDAYCFLLYASAHWKAISNPLSLGGPGHAPCNPSKHCYQTPLKNVPTGPDTCPDKKPALY